MYDELVKKINLFQTTDTSNLVKKADTKSSKIEKKIPDHNHDKYINTPEFNKLMAETFAERLAQGKLATKAEIDDFIQNTDFDDKLKN